jgi:hypothetical protein
LRQLFFHMPIFLPSQSISPLTQSQNAGIINDGLHMIPPTGGN